MDIATQFGSSVGLGSSLCWANNNARDRAHHPEWLPPSGPSPSLNEQVSSTSWTVLVRLLMSSPEQPLHKCMWTALNASDTTGGCGLVPSVNPDQATVDVTPIIRFTGWKGSAYKIWLFTHAVNMNEDATPEQLPKDYNQHLTKWPDVLFVGCKLCTQFWYNLFPSSRPKDSRLHTTGTITASRHEKYSTM